MHYLGGVGLKCYYTKVVPWYLPYNPLLCVDEVLLQKNLVVLILLSHDSIS